MPYFNEVIKPDMLSGKRVIIAAHGNSLRALVKYFDNISDDDIIGVNIPTGTPLVYEFDDDFKVIKSYYLGDQEALKAKMEAVANQGKKKQFTAHKKEAARSGGFFFVERISRSS